MLDQVKKVVLVLSGKGGVGKSTVSTQLTLGLAKAGKKVGILDIDLCGPSIGLMFNLSDKQDIMCTESGWQPVEVTHENQTFPIKVMSIAFLLKDENSAVIWRGPKKTAMIKQFLTDVNWGELDYLIVDTPPGTSDEHISIAECLRDSKANTEAVVVTTPQLVSINDVRRELSFCVKASLSVNGIIENMSGFVCPNCQECNNIFSKGGGKSLAEFAKVPYLGAIPIEPELASCMDNGENYLNKFDKSECSKNINDIVHKIINCN